MIANKLQEKIRNLATFLDLGTALIGMLDNLTKIQEYARNITSTNQPCIWWKQNETKIMIYYYYQINFCIQFCTREVVSSNLHVVTSKLFAIDHLFG
jgi:hypothetical protein